MLVSRLFSSLETPSGSPQVSVFYCFTDYRQICCEMTEWNIKMSHGNGLDTHEMYFRTLCSISQCDGIST